MVPDLPLRVCEPPKKIYSHVCLPMWVFFWDTVYSFLQAGVRGQKEGESHFPHGISQTESACSNLTPKSKLRSKSDVSIQMWTGS